MIYFISFLFIISICVNIILIFYIKKYLMKNLSAINENMFDVIKVLADFHKHLDILNSMESYIGEPVIENFIKHSKFVKSYLENFAKTHLDPNYDSEEETTEEEDIESNKQ